MRVRRAWQAGGRPHEGQRALQTRRDGAAWGLARSFLRGHVQGGVGQRGRPWRPRLQSALEGVSGILDLSWEEEEVSGSRFPGSFTPVQWSINSINVWPHECQNSFTLQRQVRSLPAAWDEQ